MTGSTDKDEETRTAGLGDVRHGFAPNARSGNAAEREPLADIAATLIADIRATAATELALIQARAALVGDGARRAAMWGAIAGGALLVALLALVIGAILALEPYVGAAIATVIVVAMLLAIAAFAGWQARGGASDIRMALKERGDNPHLDGEP
ncbi:MAG: hypothetical protein HC788_08175 [Sphingopyxis sp.]|nr:hypothetical protein [Sphingopyxis sp.]